MDFACSRCSHRQAEDASCSKCGNAVVHDLRESSSRAHLHRVESDYRRKLHARAISGGAVAALLINFAYTWTVLGLPMISISVTAIAITMALGLALVGGLEALIKGKSKFPYLNDYERAEKGAPP